MGFTRFSGLGNARFAPVRIEVAQGKLDQAIELMEGLGFEEFDRGHVDELGVFCLMENEAGNTIELVDPNRPLGIMADSCLSLQVALPYTVAQQVIMKANSLVPGSEGVDYPVDRGTFVHVPDILVTPIVFIDNADYI